MTGILKAAAAGRFEKNDVQIVMKPGEPGQGVLVEISSPVLQEYGRQIRETVMNVLQENSIENVTVEVRDRGAMDFAIRARTETAVRRALEGGLDCATAKNDVVCSGK